MYRTKEQSDRIYHLCGHRVNILPSKKQFSTIKSLSRREATAAASCVGPKNGPGFQELVYRRISVMTDIIYRFTETPIFHNFTSPLEVNNALLILSFLQSFHLACLSLPIQCHLGHYEMLKAILLVSKQRVPIISFFCRLHLPWPMIYWYEIHAAQAFSGVKWPLPDYPSSERSNRKDLLTQVRRGNSCWPEL